MIYIQPEDFSPEFTLSGVMSFLTKKDLKACSELCGFNIPSSYRKPEFVSTLSASILYHIEYILGKIPYYEIDILQRILSNEGLSYLDFPKPSDTFLFIEEAGFVLCNDDAGLSFHRKYMITDEVRNAISPVIDKVIEQRHLSRKDEFETLAVGILNIYGRVSVENLIVILEEITDQSRETICSALEGSMLIDIMRKCYLPENKDSYMLYSPFWKDTKDIDNIFDRQSNILMQYSLETYRHFGGFPYVKPLWKDSTKFYKHILETYAQSDVHASYLFHLAWKAIIRGIDADDAASEMGITPTADFERLYASFYDHFPKWELSGRSIRPISF